MKINRILTVGILGLAMMTNLSGCLNASGEDKVEDIIPVNIIETENSNLTDYIYNIGNVEAKNIKKLSFKNSGRIEKINVEVGDYVKSGDILGILTSKEVTYAADSAKAQLDSAKENLVLAEDALKKAQALFNASSISKRSYDEVKTQYEVASNSYKRASEGLKLQNNLKQENKLIANAEGYIVKVMFEEDEMISQGVPLVVVRSDSKIMNIGVTQEEIDLIKLGMEVEIDFASKKYTGNVTNIAEVADIETRTFEVEVSFEAPEIRLGSIGKTKIAVKTYEGMTLPIDVILNKGNDFVYVVENNKVIKKNIELGSIFSNKVQVNGLESGEQVISSNTNKIKAGDTIKVVQE